MLIVAGDIVSAVDLDHVTPSRSDTTSTFQTENRIGPRSGGTIFLLQCTSNEYHELTWSVEGDTIPASELDLVTPSSSSTASTSQAADRVGPVSDRNDIPGQVVDQDSDEVSDH